MILAGSLSRGQVRTFGALASWSGFILAWTLRWLALFTGGGCRRLPEVVEVAAEIAAKQFKPGLWAMAFSEAAGDEGIARALYIKLRVAQLIEEAELAATEVEAASRRTAEQARQAASRESLRVAAEEERLHRSRAPAPKISLVKAFVHR